MTKDIRLPARRGTGASGMALTRIEGMDEIVVDAPQPATLFMRKLDSDQAAIQNLLCRRRYSIRFRIGETNVHVAIRRSQAASSAYGWIEAELSGHPFRFGLPWTAARRITGVAAEAATPEDAALLLEDGLTTVLDELERQSGHTITFRRLLPMREPKPDNHIDIWFGIEYSNRAEKASQRTQIPVELPPDAAKTLAEILGQWQRPRQDDGGLSLRAGIEMGATPLTLAELASLNPGDAVIIDAADSAARIVVENQLFAAVTPSGGPDQWKMTSAFQSLPPARSLPSARQETEKTMSDQDTPEDNARTAQADDRSSISALDDLEVSMSVRFGETVVTLQDLRNAGAGSIFTLDRPDGTLVELVVNGKVIGTGDLISVAGQRAVEIRSLFRESGS
ncbi:FliM/FliN family flagellar motor switch protein [Paracoccus caeni]|uniref:FliM/FliN family flagellar motor switch protein n=1 Tax=Paracoccus caeni TaxID=657651 RepID=A0A934VYY6_9RHOB|nr:FliM/FliN family flagellar motor switch protein [Paracoccus caeni]MBK4214319.1 FliM/FliN family flagellar motor switch protein [Paracoccus caeni]